MDQWGLFWLRFRQVVGVEVSRRQVLDLHEERHVHPKHQDDQRDQEHRDPTHLNHLHKKNNYIWHLANTQILVPIKWLYCCTRKTKFMHWLQQNIWPRKDLRFTVSFVMVMLVKAIEYNRITRYLQLLYYSIDSFHLQLDSQQKNTPHKIITCS